MVVPAQGSCARPMGTCQASSRRQPGLWGERGWLGGMWRLLAQTWEGTGEIKGATASLSSWCVLPSRVPVGHTWHQTKPQGTCRGAEAVQGVSPRGPHRAGTQPPSSCCHQQPAAGRPVGGAPRVTAACGGTDPREDPSVPGVGLSNSYICAVIPFLFFKIVFHYFRPALY